MRLLAKPLLDYRPSGKLSAWFNLTILQSSVCVMIVLQVVNGRDKRYV